MAPNELFSTKAQTLLSLHGRLQSCQVLPLVIITVAEWTADPEICVEKIEKKFGSISLIIRSSSKVEDLESESNAGAFRTIQNVSLTAVSVAIDAVIFSYQTPDPDNEILIQPMLVDVTVSGVAFSHDPNTSSPYRMINYSTSNDTAEITSGVGGRLFQHAAESPVTAPPIIKPILAMIEELLVLFENTPLDCEFAVTLKHGAETIWLLQVRRLILRTTVEVATEQTARLTVLNQRLAVSMKPHPLCKGRTTIYGVMPDWNPAEILGLRPGALALSIYQELITDSVWAYQRHNYGYRNLRSFPLMHDFFGVPFVDTRVSFNSFVPADLDDSLAERLVNYYLDKLLSNPNFHDKIEFEIIFGCHTFDIYERIKELKDAKFSRNDCQTIIQSLAHLTKKVTDPKTGYWISDADKIKVLKTRRVKILSSDLDLISQIYWLLEDAKRYGSLPFAGLARAAFIATANLKSLVALDVLTSEDYDNFFLNLSTVSKSLSADRSKLTKTEFLELYGHLRPGTYDITSKRYDENPDLYFDWDANHQNIELQPRFAIKKKQLITIGILQQTQGFRPDPKGLLRYIKSSIELRESAKFAFTRNVSDALQGLVKLGERHGFSRDQMAFCDIGVVSKILTSGDDPRDIIGRSISKGEDSFQSTLKISLPPLITKPEDIWSFEWPICEPNFVTQKKISGPVAKHLLRSDLAGKIVLIPNADPGYDWLFTCNIAALVTAWGGANSHMAIRAGEIGLPAAIGVGERLFDVYSRASRLHLDCLGHRIIVVE